MMENQLTLKAVQKNTKTKVTTMNINMTGKSSYVKSIAKYIQKEHKTEGDDFKLEITYKHPE